MRSITIGGVVLWKGLVTGCWHSTTTSITTTAAALLLLRSSSSIRQRDGKQPTTNPMMATTTSSNNNNSKSWVLDPSRDPFVTAARTAPLKDDEAFRALQSELRRNHETYSIKYGPAMAFHNHGAAMMTALYRLGGSPAEILDVLPPGGAPELSGLRALEQGGGDNNDPPLIITKDNWKEHLGGCGLYGIGAHLKYPAYAEFFKQEQERNHPGGACDEFLTRTYLPTLAGGCIGDFFHALIELGYYYESFRNPQMMVQGLAWLAASHVELPEPPSPPLDDDKSKLFSSPLLAMKALSEDPHPFPTFDLLDGSSGYIAAMEDMTADKAGHERVLARYYELSSAPNDDIDYFMYEIICAAVDSFRFGGAKDFYLLHLVTGSRAAWAILKGCNDEVLSQPTKRVLLKAVWRAMILTHVARNRPWSSAASTPTTTTTCRPWSEILRIGRGSRNSHITKVVMNLADFHDKYGDDRFWLAADQVASNQDEGLRLVGTGEGSQIGRYKM